MDISELKTWRQIDFKSTDSDEVVREKCENATRMIRNQAWDLFEITRHAEHGESQAYTRLALGHREAKPDEGVVLTREPTRPLR